MSLIGSFRNSRALSLFVIWLTTVPLLAQQGNTPPAQQPGAATTQSQQSSTAQAQQQSGINPSELVVAPAAKVPQPTGTDYSRPKRYFPNPLAPYQVRNVPEVSFRNAPKLEDMIHNGQIMLSLNDAIAIGLADNLDIAIARYNLPIADTDILRTRAGASNFGVSLGTVSGTPGGGGIAATAGASGSGAGGTSAGVGGVGVGASGVVNTTLGVGPTLDSWDPIVTANLREEHQITPQSTSFLTGSTVAQQNTTTADFTYLQGFSTGSLLSLTYNNTRGTNNSFRSSLNPVLQSNFTLQIRQHLLNGWGWDIQRRFLIIARNQKRATEESFRQQVSSTVSQIQDIYWDLVAAYEDVKVKERSLALDQKTLADNKKQVEIGTLAPISVVQAESAVATDQQNLLTSRSTLQLQQLLMKNAISRNMVVGSDLMQAGVIPTDTVVVPEQETAIDVDALIQRALENRPDFIEQKINLQNRLLSIRGANNILRPSVDLLGFYGASSIAGVQNPLGICTGSNTPQNSGCTPAGAIPPTGFGTAFSNLFNSTGPDKGLAIQVTIPIRNRVGQAEQVRSQLEYRQAELSYKQLQNNLALNIRNEVFALGQDRARIIAAREAQKFAEENLDAEQKKYSLGASTSFNVMSMQSALAVAQENTITAEIAFAKQRVQLDLDTAQTLDNNNIVLNEAVTGNIKTQPNVPGIGPNTFLEQTGPQPVNPPQTGTPPTTTTPPATVPPGAGATTMPKPQTSPPPQKPKPPE